jgi:hemerythrin-like domain-containing protein
MSNLPVLTDAQLEQVSRLLGDCATGSEITRVLNSLGLDDVSGESTKWRRLYGTFLHYQRQDRAASKLIDFIRTFADGCHHAKEEDLLFVRLGERGFPTQGGPVAVMLHEHELGRAHVAAVADGLEAAAAGDEVAREAVAKHLAGYADLLRHHIFKEDNVLFPMADQALSTEDQVALAADFARVEHDEIGEGVHERYEALARELAGR